MAEPEVEELLHERRTNASRRMAVIEYDKHYTVAWDAHPGPVARGGMAEVFYCFGRPQIAVREDVDIGECIECGFMNKPIA